MPLILIVEDDSQIRTLLKETLEQEGFSTIVAEHGLEALALYEKNEIDLVITDILMPEKEGLGLITDLRKADPLVKIIAISGGAPQISPGCNLDLARMFGAQHTFQKPLDVDALVRTIHDMLSQKTA